MWMIEIAIGLGTALALVALYLLTCIRVLNEYERGLSSAWAEPWPSPRDRG